MLFSCLLSKTQVNIATPFAENLVTFGSDLGQTVLDVVPSDLVEILPSAFDEIGSNLHGAVSTVADTVPGALGEVGSHLHDVVVTVGDTVPSALHDFGSAVIDTAPRSLDHVARTFENFGTTTAPVRQVMSSGYEHAGSCCEGANCDDVNWCAVLCCPCWFVGKVLECFGKGS
jgi:hypothetical protein